METSKENEAEEGKRATKNKPTPAFILVMIGGGEKESGNHVS